MPQDAISVTDKLAVMTSCERTVKLRLRDKSLLLLFPQNDTAGQLSSPKSCTSHGCSRRVAAP
jgi:hypothetical protein